MNDKFEYLEIGKGWQPIVRKYLDQILTKGGQVRQIKEKFGDLRFYVSGSEEIQDLARKAEIECIGVCENCGKPGTHRGKNWIKTLCESCPRVEHQ